MDSLEFAHQEDEGVKIWRFNIAAEGCGSARFNLKPFYMAPGDYVVVYGLDEKGRQTGMERCEGKGWGDLGEINSLHVMAKELVLEMHASSADSHFVINYVHYANCFQERSGVPDYCGKKDWANIVCYNEYNSLTALGPSVFRLRLVHNKTPFFCTSDNSHYLTTSPIGTALETRPNQARANWTICTTLRNAQKTLDRHGQCNVQDF